MDTQVDSLLSDQQLRPIEWRVREEYRTIPDDARFYTAVIHPPPVDDQTFAPEAWFAIDMPHPRRLQRDVGLRHMRTFRTRLSSYREYCDERDHFAAAQQDLEYRLFRALGKLMSKDIESFKSQNDDVSLTEIVKKVEDEDGP